MDRTAQGVSLGGAEHPLATDTPSLYLIDDAADCAARALTQEGTPDTHCLVYLVPLKRPKVRSTPERRRQLRDGLAGGTASHNAAVLARDPHFWDYLQQINLTAYDAEIDARRARHFINQVCGVTGRHELDHQASVTERFFTFVQQPFLHWLLAGA